jgi:hypothetical protein|nr:MAG TPA: Protein of unknown function (DUF3106) [Caudoviricetes sp.]
MLCERCGSEIILRARTLHERKRDGLPNLCKSCIRSDAASKRWASTTSEERKDAMKHIHQKRDEYFSNMDDAARMTHCNKIKKSLENMSEGEKKRSRSDKMSVAMKTWWANLTDDEYKEACEARKRGWQNMSEERRQQWMESVAKAMNSDSYKKRNREIMKALHERQKLLAKQCREERERKEKRLKPLRRSMHINKLRIRKKEWWDKDSDKKKKEQSERMKKWWSSLSKEEIDAWNKKRLMHQPAPRTSGNELEETFINYMKSFVFDLSVERQYKNKIEHEDFSTIFKPEDIGVSRISPYHRWDFKITFPSEDSILIDVDGPIHNETGAFMVNGMDVVKYIKFNDSQRPYQTDGLDAYVVQAYDGNINDNCKVLSLKYEEVITVRDLVLYICSEYHQDIVKENLKS